MAPHSSSSSSSMRAPAPAANNSAPDALPPAAAVPAFAPDVSAGPPPYNPYHKHLQPPPPAPSHPTPSSSMMAGPGGAAQVAAAAAAAAAAASVSAAAMSTHYAPNPAASFQQSPPPPHLQHAPGPSAAAAAAQPQPLPPPPPPPMAVQQPPIAPASVYLANYSGVPVFELTVRGIAVMRRRQDGFLNATQILKVAGVDKGKRTKILEKEIQQGEHDKVQGGYGKYQGTWIPLSRAQELSATHNVSHILKPLLLFDPATETSIPNAAPRRRPNPNAPHQSLGRAAANATAPAKGGENTSLQSMTGSASGMGASGAAWDSSLGGSDGVRGSAPTHQPRFLALRSPASTAPGADFLHLQEPTSSSDPRPPPPLPLPLPLPASTSQQMMSTRESIGEDVFGPLTATTAAASKMLPGSGSKRSSATSNLGHETQYDDDDGGGSGSGEPAAKRARGQDGSIARSGGGGGAGMLLGPSPVKDLNALHPSAGLLQAASHPRPGSAAAPFRSPAASAAMAAANVRASAWNAAASSSSSSSAAFHHANGNLAGAASLRSVPRYADRPRLPRASDEGERRARELLIHLFVDDGTGAGHGLLRGWTALDGTLESSGGAMGMGVGIGPGGSTTGHQQQAAAVRTPAEIAAAARAPFVFGAAAVGAVRANAGPTPGSGAVLPPDVAQRKLDELLALLIRAVGLDGFEDAIASAGAGASSSSAGAAAGAMMGAVRRGGAIDLDIVTDDHGHTVLHWAAALGRLELVSVLLARPPVGSAGPQAAPLATDGDVLTSSSSEKGKQREQQEQPAYSHSHIHGIPVGGANPNAGNHAGETALQRTVLVVNAWEHGYFPHLLRLLAPALMTRDFRGRTVLHHVALVSGLRGRAAGARYYLECILEFAREVYGGAEGRRTGGAEEGGQGEGGSGPVGLGLGLGLGLGVGGASTPSQRRPVGAGLTPGTERATPAGPGTGAGASTSSSSSALRLPTYVLENLVDAQDEDGETALGIVARLGNAGLVKLLLDAGARKDIPNLLGIRPSDWGLEMVGLGSINGTGAADTGVDLNGGDAARVAVGNELAATRPHDIMAALGSRVKRTPMKSSDILESISHSLEDLNSTYTSELSEKNAALEAVQMLLKQQTRELANRRRDVSDAQGRADAREETVQRLNNLVGVLNSLKVGPEEEREVVEHWLSSSSSSKKGTRRSGAGGDGDVSMEDGGGSAALAPIPLLDELSSAPGLFTSARSQRVESVVRLEFVLPLLQRECETLEHAIGEIEGAQRVKDAQYRRLVSICSGVPERNVVEMLDELVLAIESDGADVDLDRLSGFLDKIQPRTQGSALTTTTTTAGGVGAAGGGSSMEADAAMLARSAVPVANGRG